MIERNFHIQNINLEKLIFFLVVLINLIPVVAYKYFPTLDGPAHLFNAEVINELIFNKASEFKSYFLIKSPFGSSFLIALIAVGAVNITETL